MFDRKQAIDDGPVYPILNFWIGLVFDRIELLSAGYMFTIYTTVGITLTCDHTSWVFELVPLQILSC